MYRFGKSGRYIYLLVVVLTLILNSFVGNQLVYAEGDDTQNEIKRNTHSDPMYESEHGVYKDENVDYSLDLVSPSEIEDKGFFDSVWDTVTFKAVGEKFSDAFHYTMFSIVQFLFDFNIFMTNAMIGILDFAYDTNLVNTLIDSLENSISSMTGISGGQFTSSGLFGGFLGIIGVIVAIYTLYQFIVKRASISAFGGLLKSVTVLVVALLFFTNYTTIIKGINSLSIEASGLILAGNAETVVAEGNIVNTTVKEKMNDNLFNMFVHKPYLMLQYGTTDQKAIGEGRVLNLLRKKSGTEERKEMAVNEVTSHGNDTLTYPNLLKRMNFMAILLTANAVNSLPVYLLSLSLVVFQFWFIIMAMIAPFVLLWAALPNQIGVLKRYFFELSIPLILKIGVSFLALLIFGFSEVMYALTSLGSGSFGIILSTTIQSLLMFTLFLLRKRIFSVFSIGSTQLNAIREEMGNSFVKPLKKGVQTTVTTAGAIGGAVVAGPQGAMVGASMGNSIGSAATGESDVADSARNVGMSMYMADRMKGSQNRMSSNPNMESREERVQTNEEKAMDLANNDTSYNRLRSYLQSKELPTETINETLLAVDKLNLDNIETGEIQKQYNNMAYLTEQGKGSNKLFADSFAKGLKINREQQAIKQGISLEGNAINSNSINSSPMNNPVSRNGDQGEELARQQVVPTTEFNRQNEADSDFSLKTYSLDQTLNNNTTEEPPAQDTEYRLENDN